MVFEYFLKRYLKCLGQLEGIFFLNGGISAIFPPGNSVSGHSNRRSKVELGKLQGLSELTDFIAVDSYHGRSAD